MPDEAIQFGPGGIEIVGVPDGAQFGSDALPDRNVRRMMDGVLGQMKLAALPLGPGEHCRAGGAEAGVVVADDELDAAHAPGHQGVEEFRPVDLGFGERRRDAEQSPAAIGADPDGGQDRGVADDAAVTDLLIAGIQHQLAGLTQGAQAPRFELAVQEGLRAADLGGRQALEAELGHDLSGIAGGDALDVNLGERQHDGARGAPPALQELGIEGLGGVLCLRHLDLGGPRWRVDLLGLVAVGVTLPGAAALVVPGAEVLLPLHAHGEVEQRGECLPMLSGPV